jgi:hypothetical protein
MQHSATLRLNRWGQEPESEPQAAAVSLLDPRHLRRATVGSFSKRVSARYMGAWRLTPWP